MRLDRIVDLAKMFGYRVHRDFPGYRGFPFCKMHLVRVVILRLPPSTTYTKDVELYEVPTGEYIIGRTAGELTYTKRYLTEMKKSNERFLNKLREHKGIDDVVAALDFCT
jgi:hypothetical protein